MRAVAAASDPAHSTKGMVATAHPLATEAALEILRAGGNAVDAAVAATFAISVVEPFSAGIGGGGFAVVHQEPDGDEPGRISALDFRETAPLAATSTMFIDPATGRVRDGLSTDGHLSVAVPGTVAGLQALHEAHGKLPWRRVVEPAIDLARDGFAVTPRLAEAITLRRDTLVRFPASAELFFKAARSKDGAQALVPLEPGDKFRQRDLANTLRDIARNPRSFYEGRVARAIHEEMKRGGGLLTQEDLRAYKPTWREPVCGPWRDLRLCAMPPPSSGGVHLLQILRLLEGTDLQALGWHSADGLHKLIEAMRIAYADRAVHLGDPAFVKVPVAELTSKNYADLRRPEIDPLRARRSADVKAASPEVLARVAASMASKHESQDTSHLVVVDDRHNAVSLTFTVNWVFGSGLVVPGTGVLLNDEMDDFAAAPGVPNLFGLVGGEANAVQPKKIPLSSMTPLIATREGKFFLAAGSPGGSTIITTVLQTLLHVAVWGMDAQAAVAAPRLHHQWLPDKVTVDKFGFDVATLQELERRGHRIEESAGWGNAMCVVRGANGILEGGADPRGEGLALGP